jgi:hypothetical protein
MPRSFENRRFSPFEVALLAALVALSGFFVLTTLHWPLVGDASLIHYVVFLMQHGRAPYRDIVDINMPGMYLIDWVVIKCVGSGSLAWRFFDLLLMAVAAVGMLVIAWPHSRFAGCFSAALFLLIHGRDGIAQTGQRDLIMSALLLASMVFLFLAFRNKNPYLIALTGLFAGIATTVKPTAALFTVAFLIAAFLFARKCHSSGWRYLANGIAGLTLPIAIIIIFLACEDALAAFWVTLHGLVLYHAGLDHHPLGFLLLHSISPLLPLVVPWAYLMIRQQRWRCWEDATLLIAIACGLISYCVQGKGYPYHRYPLLAFLLLSMGLCFTSAWRARGFDRVIGGAALLVGVLVIAPTSAVVSSRYDWRNQEFFTSLQSDLDRLGGAGLSNHIQCMDTSSGCIDTLDRMDLIQSTGFLYDCYVLNADQTPVTEEIRTRFWKALQANPPRVFVVTDQLCLGNPPAFGKIGNWPLFNRYLDTNYVFTEERKPSKPMRWWSRAQMPASYRIYIQKKDEAP